MSKPLQTNIPSELRRLLRLGSYFMRRMDRNADLTTRQLATLQHIAEQPRTVSWIAEAHGFTAPAASQLVRRLDDAGYVTRESSRDDRRGVVVTITGYGRKLMEKEAKRREAVLATMLTELKPEETEAIVTALPILNKLFSNEAHIFALVQSWNEDQQHD